MYFSLAVRGARAGTLVKFRKGLCKRVLISMNWFQAFNLFCIRTVHGMPKIPILLQAQPEIRRHAQNTRKSQCCIRSYRTFAFNNFIETRIRNAQASSEFCLCKAKRLDKFFKKHFPRVCWGPISRQPPPNFSGNLNSCGVRSSFLTTYLET